MKKKIMSVLLIIMITITGLSIGNKDSLYLENEYSKEQLQILRSDLKLTQEQVVSKVKAKNLVKNKGYLDSDEIIAIITLSDEALIDCYLDDYQLQSVAQYAASEQGKRQQEKINSQQNELIDKLFIKDLIDSVEYQYNTIVNAISIKTTYGDFKDIEQLTDVENAIISNTYNLPQATSTDTSTILNIVDVYETGIFNSSTVSYTGKGTAVAVLDSGFDLSHTVFQNQPEEQMITQEDVSQILADAKATEFTEDLKTSDVYYSGKIPFVYDYADKDANVFPFNSDHGTHVAGIIGGKDEKITGVAVNTQLVLLKVFPDIDDGADSSDIIAALEDAVLLNVDAINLSLGSSCGFAREKDDDAINEIYDKINDSGISLLTAASNSYSSGYGGEQGNTNLVTNPDSGTVGSPSTYAAALSVASISGVKSSYIVANDNHVFFYTESNSISGQQNNFIKDIGFQPGDKKTYEYVTIPGVGKRINYDNVGDLTGKIALVRRGDNTFEEKALNAKNAGAVACIIYNNIDGDISMSMGKTDHIPTVSVSKDDGATLAKLDKGTLTIAYAQQAGPFMSDFSSWGPLPSLELKPEITAHGGNITSAIPGGGYDQISGTSMATPNLCGIVVLIRQHLKEKYPDLSWKEISVMTNELLMSTASIIKNEHGNPYSPRKQGAGLASLYNAVTANGYIDINGKDKTKLELFDDPNKTGIYTMDFNIVNLSNKALEYDLSVIGMTESVSTTDNKHVSETSKVLSGTPNIEVLSGGSLNGNSISVNASETASIKVVYTLTAADKKYIDSLFPYGMYVEGFVKLTAKDDKEIDLNVPFLGFYGNWAQAPMFDKTYYEVESEAHNAAIDNEDKIKADYFATTPYGSYYYNYIIPLGTYLYDIDTTKYDEIPASEDKIAISDYLGTIDGIFSVYAGLLRNVKTMKYTITDKLSGEVLYEHEEYNVRKAFSNGGAPFPSADVLKIKPTDLGLINNREYEFKMIGLLDYKDSGANSNTRNSFSFDFTLDNEAPLLKEVIYEKEYDRTLKKDRYYMTMNIYDNHYVQSITPIIFTTSNSYTFLTENPIPVYSEKGKDNKIRIEITDQLKDISEDALITSALGFSIDDYAMNSSIYMCQLPGTKGDFKFTKDGTEEGIDLQILSMYEDEVIDITKYLATKDDTVDENKTYLKYLAWESADENIATVKDGQVRGIKQGRTTIIVTEQMDLKKAVLIINVKARPDKENLKVTNGPINKYRLMSQPSESKTIIVDDEKIENIRFSYFETIFAYSRAGQTSEIAQTGSKTFISSISQGSATPTLSFYPGEKIKLFHELEPWYVEDKYELVYKSHNPDVASIDEEGVITGLKKGAAIIQLGVKGSNLVAKIRVEIKSEFIIENRTLIAYKGLGGKVVIPDDEGILFIGPYAFCLYDTDMTVELEEEDYDSNKIPSMNTSVTSVVIPEGVEEIQKYAFYNSSGLKSVEIPSSVKYIRENAFEKNVALTSINLKDVKAIGQEAFRGCEELINVSLDNIYAIGASAFEGCEKIESVNLTTLRNVGKRAFKDCIALSTVTLSENTALAEAMFVNSGLVTVDIYEKVKIPNFLFAKSEKLETINIHNDLVAIGEGALSECTSLVTVNFNAEVAEIADQVFYGSTSLKKFVFPNNEVKLGNHVFYMCSALEEVVFGANTKINNIKGSVFKDTNLLKFTVNEANPYYTADENLLVSKDGKTIILATTANEFNEYVIDSKYEVIGEGAFSGANITSLTITNNRLVISDYAFANIDTLTIVVLPVESGLVIGEHAFNNSKNLKTINNLVNVLEVGNYAFANSGLIEVEIGANAIYGEGAFFKSKLEKVTIGENTDFGMGSFQSCLNLKVVKMPEGGNVHFGESAFAYDIQLSEIDLSKVGNRIENTTFYGCESLKAANLVNVEYIGEYAFSDCGNLFTLNIPMVIEIGKGAFSRNNQFKEAPQFSDLVLPETLTTIGEGAFLGCKGITEVILPTSLIEMSDYLFAFCINLRTVVLPSHIKVIGKYSFSGCESLSSINLENVEEVQEFAFTSATQLQDIDLTAIVKVGEGGFASTNIKGSYTVNNLLVLADYAFQSTSIEEFFAPKLEEIGISAFQFNKKLTKFVFTNNLKSIGHSAFNGCTTLTSFFFVDDKGKEVANGTINDFALLDNGILYTKLKNGGLELTSVPSALKTETLEVLEGTTRVDRFSGNENLLVNKIVLPDSLKSIGNYAFYNYKNLKGVEFKSFTAPALENSYNYEAKLEETDPGYDIIHKHFNVFEWELCYYNFIDLVGKKEPIEITLPANDKLIGYDSLVYLVYFGEVSDAKHSNYEAMSNNMIDYIESVEKIEKLEVITIDHENLINNAITSLNKINQNPNNFGYSTERWNEMEKVVRDAKDIVTQLKIANSPKNLKDLQDRIDKLPKTFDISKLELLRAISFELNALKFEDKALLKLENYNVLLASYQEYIAEIPNEIVPVLQTLINSYKVVTNSLSWLTYVGFLLIFRKRWGI